MSQNFDPNRLLKPDYQHYARMDFWTEEEAIHLLSGIRPLSEFPLPEFIRKEDIGPRVVVAQEMRYDGYVSDLLGGLEEIDRTRNLLRRAIEVGAVEKIGTSPSGDSTIRPGDFVNWAATKGLPIPPELGKALGLKEPDISHPKLETLLPVPQGTSWGQIRITAISDEAVRIKTPNGEARYNYSELGFSDKRKVDEPNQLWPLLLIFARLNGDVSPKDGHVEGLPDKAKRLNKHLQRVFGINDSIFQAHYKKHHRYTTKIAFSDQRQR